MAAVALGVPTFGAPAHPVSSTSCGPVGTSSTDPGFFEDLPTADRPPSDGLIDRFGRAATDLRVSLTDRCNLRCTYCMPAEGLDWLPNESVLNDAELLRLIQLGVDLLGINEVRFTGGEPLLRKGIVELIASVAALTNRPEMSLTTNGLGLVRKAVDLKNAGLDRLNVSLDTMNPETFTKLTRRPRHGDVIASLAAAADAGLLPVKVNAVLMRGVNDHEALDLLEFCLQHGYQLRFIEQMPLDAQHGWDRSTMVTADEITELLSARYTLAPHAGARGGSPAELFTVDGDRGTVGIIASVTRPFCGDCDRTRLTADGQIRNCLFSSTETDLRALLRSGAHDEEIAAAWRGGMWTKLPGHGINDPSFLQPDRPMSAIGG
ncbi:GTP 3',8-cyclase MoaA [Nakamurella antarctica]|uniref:GTP 3',8-cyclase n=1 Tax=Nakamurella antarctica TaxID=1902245 RepID=A0A3G8ZJ84_9ACTN|nr:GTP 3',8-cyclase MoaA [Nakamurella antarctica]AZI57258.1 GTP 3',8-cyclase MoaA [Nakamurella antarctica]